VRLNERPFILGLAPVPMAVLWSCFLPLADGGPNMSMTISVRIGYCPDGGDDLTATLPAMFVVCQNCGGHGTHLCPSLRGASFSSEEFEDLFDTEEDRAEYFRHGGKYDVTCASCNGRNVVLVVNEAACSKEQLTLFQQHMQLEAEEARERAIDARVMRAECGYAW
jgi:hypothetical protein